MKWILIILGVGLVRGLIFPDYKLGASIFIIPFATPILLAALSSYFSYKKNLSFLKMSIWGLLSVYLSTVVGILVYGFNAGWHYVTEDSESQIVYSLTLKVQTIVYLVVIVVSYFIIKRAITSVSSGLERGSGR